LSLFSGSRSDSTVPDGSFLKASSVGANTVKGPSPAFQGVGQICCLQSCSQCVERTRRGGGSDDVFVCGNGIDSRGADEDR
jgi:hypothetical protein